jgi:hypothetical protein
MRKPKDFSLKGGISSTDYAKIPFLRDHENDGRPYR